MHLICSKALYIMQHPEGNIPYMYVVNVLMPSLFSSIPSVLLNQHDEEVIFLDSAYIVFVDIFIAYANIVLQVCNI